MIFKPKEFIITLNNCAKIPMVFLYERHLEKLGMMKMERFQERVWLASPTMHGEEMKYITEAYETNWMSTIGANIDAVEQIAAEKTGMGYAVALASCTAALHLCLKLAGEKLYGKPALGHGALEGKRVFCSDMTFVATLNPVVYEGGTPIFVDTDAETWNMDPVALERAFSQYPDVKLVVSAELYGFPGHMDKIKEVCDRHGAILVEDAAEALGARVHGKPCGSFSDYTTISYNGNKIITGSSGGCLLTNDKAVAEQARKLSTQARDNAPWYQHTQIGYNYRMSNVIAGVIRGQYPYLEEHISLKKAIYERYREGFKDLSVQMNPIAADTEPNYWLSAIVIDRAHMCRQTRGDTSASYITESGKSCPTEILEALEQHNAEGRPIWKPMHIQPVYAENPFVSREDDSDVSADIFERGLCLPSDIKMTNAQQDRIIEIVKRCFD